MSTLVVIRRSSSPRSVPAVLVTCIALKWSKMTKSSRASSVKPITTCSRKRWERRTGAHPAARRAAGRAAVARRCDPCVRRAHARRARARRARARSRRATKRNHARARSRKSAPTFRPSGPDASQGDTSHTAGQRANGLFRGDSLRALPSALRAQVNLHGGSAVNVTHVGDAVSVPDPRPLEERGACSMHRRRFPRSRLQSSCGRRICDPGSMLMKEPDQSRTRSIFV